MDPPRQGVCGGRDSRHFAGIAFDDDAAELEIPNHKYIHHYQVAMP
jgi:hypothetical protein